MANDGSGSDPLAHPERLSSRQQSPISTEQALLRFDSLGAVEPDELTGRWRGSGLHTGHPLDGLLERFGWYGKAFETSEIVHPLLFHDRKGGIYAVDPARVPLRLAMRMPALARSSLACTVFAVSRRLLRTSRPSARLRKIEDRGVASACIVYNRIPVIDHLRKVDDNHVLGLMDLRSVPQPFFFLLSRDQA
jgi:hypothetical protein